MDSIHNFLDYDSLDTVVKKNHYNGYATLTPNDSTVSFTHPVLTHSAATEQYEPRVDISISNPAEKPIETIQSGSTLTLRFAPGRTENVYIELVVWKFVLPSDNGGSSADSTRVIPAVVS